MTEDKFIDIFELKQGNIKQTCKAIGVSRQWYYNHYKVDTFKKRVDDVMEGLIDDTVSQLHINIQEGKEASVFYFLKTQAKHRGYGESIANDNQEVTTWV